MRYVLVFLIFVFSMFAKPVIVVSIPMQKEFIESITNDYEVVSLINGGIDPHTFEPKISDMKLIGDAVAYFAIGIEFEEKYLDKFKAQNKNLKIYNNDKNIEKIYSNHNHDGHDHSQWNKHVWLSLKNAKIIANNIYESLQDINSVNYDSSYESLIEKIDSYDLKIQNLLKDSKVKEFVVFHPMLTYFARDYGLIEISIEVDGKSPRISEMMSVVDGIKKNNIKFVFAQREFSTKSAELIARESGAKLEYFSPLDVPLCESLYKFSEIISK
ncbi:zinc ABC transporter substrate-binding protein [Helicobacter sp. WB40]|nr:zinc ABC transporter substrate-binding protein [Helicobacter sp. WB40]